VPGNRKLSEEEKKAEAAKITKQKFSHFHPTVRGRADDPLEYPTLLTLACNAFEVVRLRNRLLLYVEQA
jgi:hypothetical protein